MGVYHDVLFTEAIDRVRTILNSPDPDVISDMLERVAVDQDMAHACLMLLTMVCHGVDISKLTGIELSNAKPTITDLILPPGVSL